jgi:TPR repeat protein
MPADAAAAVQWYRRAAHTGHICALAGLARIELGEGVEHEVHAELSVDQNTGSANGTAVHTASAVPTTIVDSKLCFDYLEHAARNGDALARQLVSACFGPY